MSTTKQAISEMQANKKLAVKKATTTKADVVNGKGKDEQMVDEVKKLDQIRDMLFGEHVASLKDEYQTLDKNLDQNVSVLRKELATSIEELKKQIDKKFDQLQKSLQQEESVRETQNEEINATLSRVNSDILTTIGLETKRLDQALNDQHQESAKQLNTMVDSLQNAKVDRTSLAKMFNQFAKELEGS